MGELGVVAFCLAAGAACYLAAQWLFGDTDQEEYLP